MENIICNKCNGNGYINNFICDKCIGDGKVNWVENVTGKNEQHIFENIKDEDKSVIFKVWQIGQTMKRNYNRFRFMDNITSILKSMKDNEEIFLYKVIQFPSPLEHRRGTLFEILVIPSKLSELITLRFREL